MPDTDATPMLPSDLRRAFRPAFERTLDLSVVAPAFNEAPNLPALVDRIRAALPDDLRWELVLVDDGSQDGTTEVLHGLCEADPRVVGVFLAENRGQTAATAAGIAVARGRLLATIDADLQNDPVDLPMMMGALGDHDAVVGIRVKREDSWVRRTSSRVANGIRNRLSGDSIRDTGCALKLFRTEALEGLPLFEGMHRFLPTLMRIHGHSVIEVPVHHHPRTGGESKYNVANRVFRASRDLIAVRWMRSRTIHLPVASVHSAGRDRAFG